MESFQEWALGIAGLVFKVAMDRLAAREQLALGFIWDSVTLTRTLESRKLESYLALLNQAPIAPAPTWNRQLLRPNHCNRKPETKPLEPMQCTPVT